MTATETTPAPEAAAGPENAVQVEHLDVSYRVRGRDRLALRNVSFQIARNESYGLVGESGSGKSTLIRCVMSLIKPDSGSIDYDRIDVAAAQGARLTRLRREVQLVYQDPSSSLNPRMTVEHLVAEGLVVHRLCRTKAQRRERVVELLESVGLSSGDLDRFPRSFSGGQRQRIAVARALAVGPRLLVCDEPVSSLDVSVQAQVLNLLLDLAERGLTILFVAHDLAVVRQVCASVAVIERGRIVEHGRAADVLTSPQAEYTRALVAAAPVPDPRARPAR
jgi:ABC-type glutathione transport system ATPase component